MKYDDLKIKKLGIRDLKPCSFCSGPLKGGIFRVITVQIATINPRAVNAFRLKSLQLSGATYIPDVTLTAGFTINASAPSHCSASSPQPLPSAWREVDGLTVTASAACGRRYSSSLAM